MTYEITIERFDETLKAVTFKTSRFAETMDEAEQILDFYEAEGYEAEIFEVIAND